MSHTISRSADLVTPMRGFWAKLQWTLAFAAARVAKRLRRATPGAGIEPKYPALRKMS